MSRVHGWLGCALGASVLLLSATAAAESVDSEDAEVRDDPCPPATTRHSYGWQTLTTDGVGIGLLVLGGSLHYDTTAAGTAFAGGLGSLLLGAPIVHAAHGRWPTGVLSFGMRLTLPIVGGYVASNCTGSECGGGLVAGLLIGIAPIWIDAGLLAWEEVPVESARNGRSPRRPRLLARLGVSELHPTTKVTRRGFELGVGGKF